MIQDELGIISVSLKPLQGSILGKICENTLAATPDTV